jgi:hypothetical protein
VALAVAYTPREARLTPAATPTEAADTQHASGAIWTLPLSTKTADRLPHRGNPGVASEKNGFVIAMTPIDANAP